MSAPLHGGGLSCATKYPVLLVHCAGARDRRRPNYWGRIPAALKAEGARVYYGNQDAWGAIEHNARVLKAGILRILAATGCGKVNIIAHSKGGLDARYMISSLNMAKSVASLTTVATTHHGSKSMDKILRAPDKLYRAASAAANLWFRLLGDAHPDFYTASHQFSTRLMREFNTNNPDSPLVFYQSHAAVMKTGFSDVFMLFPYLFVRRTEGENDGLVTPASAAWGNFRGVLRGANGRGISHADEVDARRRNFTKKPAEHGVADIRRVYVEIAAGLRQAGF